MQHKTDVTISDRILATGSYLTLGFIGMIWLIVSMLIVKKPMSRYLTCNIVQSFVLSILYAILSLAYSIFIGLLTSIPFIGGLFLKLHIFLFATPVFNTMNFINYLILLFLCYLSIIAIFGKLPYVPYITDIAKKIL